MSAQVLLTAAFCAMLLIRTVSAGDTTTANSPFRLTVIKYCLEPFATFEIVGTDAKGIKQLEQLTQAVKEHKAKHPDAEYEVLAQVKSVPEFEQKIVAAIEAAGITLQYYWSATSCPGGPDGPYGVGFQDHMGHYRNATNSLSAREPASAKTKTNAPAGSHHREPR